MASRQLEDAEAQAVAQVDLLVKSMRARAISVRVEVHLIFGDEERVVRRNDGDEFRRR